MNTKKYIVDSNWIKHFKLILDNFSQRLVSQVWNSLSLYQCYVNEFCKQAIFFILRTLKHLELFFCTYTIFTATYALKTN